MKKVKIGKGYWPNSYGRGFRKDSIVWLINGKAYSYNTPFQTDLEGYIMVNYSKMDTSELFAACGLVTEHQQYNKTN